MPIFYNKKIIFVRIPKTASLSMYTSIIDAGGLEWDVNFRSKSSKPGPLHEKITEIKGRLKSDLFDDFFKFAFIRNPWDWFLSWIVYKQTLNKYKTLKRFDFNEWVEEIGAVIESRGGEYWTPGLEFTKYIVGEKPIGCSFQSCRSHMRGECVCLVKNKQYEYIYDKDKNLLVDFVGRFENIEEDWAFVTSKVGLKDNLVHLNKSNHKYYREVYTDKTAEIVYNLFKKDIDLFGYKF